MISNRRLLVVNGVHANEYTTQRMTMYTDLFCTGVYINYWVFYIVSWQLSSTTTKYRNRHNRGTVVDCKMDQLRIRSLR